MSYARFGVDCDVYVFLATDGHVECSDCALIEGHASARLPSSADAITHLRRHRAAGHKVPDRCIERLLEDAGASDA